MPKENEMTPMQHIVKFLSGAEIHAKLEAAKAQGVDVERYKQLALASIGASLKLQSCSLQSIAQSLLESVSLGLPISSAIGYGCLVPYKGRAAFQPMYLGRLRLAYNEGGATTAAAEIVREGDVFEYQLGTAPYIKHVKLADIDAPIFAAYAIVHIQNGPPFVSVWTISELQSHGKEHVNEYQMQKGEALFVTDFPAWCKKTAMIRCTKLMPMRSELARQVMQRDEYMEAGVNIEPAFVNGSQQTPQNIKELAKANPLQPLEA